jgi:arsenate reductase-like glutaredoxin family protein
MKNLETCMNAIEVQYKDVKDIVNSMLNKYINPLDNIINNLTNNIYNLTIDEIRIYLLQLQTSAYTLSDIKEKTLSKANIAEVIQKNNYAEIFNSSEGTAAARDKKATIETSGEAITQVIYDLAGSLLKNKVDQIHRLVDVLKSILISRQQELKIENLKSDSEIPPTEKIKLYESMR